MKKNTLLKLKIYSVFIILLLGCSQAGVTPKDDLIDAVDLTGRWQMTSTIFSYQAKVNGIIETDKFNVQGTISDVIEFKSGSILNDPNDVFLSGVSQWNYKQAGSEISIGNGIEISYFKVTQSGKTLKLEMNATLAKKSLKESKDFNKIIYLDPQDDVIQFEYIIEFVAAQIAEDPKLAPSLLRNISGEWLSVEGGAGGTNNFESFKNFQYNFEVGANNQKVDINLKSSEIDVQLALFDPLGQRINVSTTGRSVATTYTLNAGKYRLVICAARRAVGKYEFLINGILANPIKISRQLLQSGTQSWGDLGGGGLDKSFKNHLYTFEIVDDNSSIDVELESPDTEVALYLYDELGQRIVFESDARYEFKILKAKKGIYTVMAATRNRNSVGNYRVNVFGKVRNLQRIASQFSTATGRLATNESFDTYSLQINSTANSPLDVEVSSAEFNPFIYLQNSVGANIETTLLPKRLNFIVSKDYAKGIYRIKILPGGNKEFGSYKINVHGQFTDFKKL